MIGIRNLSCTGIHYLESERNHSHGIQNPRLSWAPPKWSDLSFRKLRYLLKSTSNKNSACNENLFLLPSSCNCLKFVLPSLRISSVLCFVHVQTFFYLCCWTRGTSIAIKDHYIPVRNKQWPALRSPCNVFIQTTRKWYRRYKEKESIRWHRLNRSR